MKAWAKDQSITGDGLITFWADNLSVLTKALGMAISHPGPSGDLGPADRRHTAQRLVAGGLPA